MIAAAINRSKECLFFEISWRMDVLRSRPRVAMLVLIFCKLKISWIVRLVISRNEIPLCLPWTIAHELPVAQRDYVIYNQLIFQGFLSTGIFTDQCMFVFVIADKLEFYEKGSSIVQPFSKRKRRNVNGKNINNYISITLPGILRMVFTRWGLGLWFLELGENCFKPV